MGSGYTHCARPECFEITVSSDMDKPELCGDCGECDSCGSDPCTCHLTDEVCVICENLGIETEATEMSHHVAPDGKGGLHRFGDPEPMCHDCGEQSRAYPLETN